MEEIWKDIRGYEGHYQISNDGRIKSVGRISVHKRLKQWNIKEKYLTPTKVKAGYFVVALCKNGNEKQHHLHVLKAAAFIPNPTNLPIVRHINDIKSDNDLENLAWGTHADNTADMIRNGNNKFDKKGKDSVMYGKTGANSHNKRLVLDTATGIFYDTVKEAAVAKGIKRTTLGNQLVGRNSNRTSFIYA